MTDDGRTDRAATMSKGFQLNVWRDLTNRSRCLECWDLCLDLLDHRWPGSRGRAIRVERGCEILAAQLGMTEDDRFALRLVARYHDVGMLGVPAGRALAWPETDYQGRPCAPEHAVLGSRLIHKTFPDFPDAVEGIWYHHERPDGKGPFGLRHGEIPLCSSIVFLVDAVEIMIRRVPEGGEIAVESIVDQVERGSGSLFPENAVTAFLAQAPAVYRALRMGPDGVDIRKQPLTDAEVQGFRDDLCPDIGDSPNDQQPERESTPRTIVRPQRVPPEKSPRTEPSPAGPSTRGAGRLRDLSPVTTREELLAVIRSGLDLKPLTANVRNVLSTISRTGCSADDMAEALGHDPALSVRVLKLANSSAYASRRAPRTLKQAVNMIGIQEVRNAVISLDVVDKYGETFRNHLDPTSFWEHSIACGLLAAAIAKARHVKNAEGFFLQGLLHDIGRAILLEHAEDHYVQVFKAAQDLAQPLEAVERQLLSITHCQVLEVALECWSLPADSMRAALNHHQPVHAIRKLAPEQRAEVATVVLADRLAHAFCFGDSGNRMLYPLDEITELLALPIKQLEQIKERIAQEVYDMKLSMLANTGSGPTATRISDLKERLGRDVSALCVGSSPETNAPRIFLERIAGSQLASPNLGLITLPDANSQEVLTSRFDAEERRHGSDKLPIVMICQKGTVNVEHAWMKRRRHAVFSTPVFVPNLIAAVKELLQADEPRAPS